VSRIRSIKPDFWTDSKIVTLPMEARLFFIGMWNFVDDFGVTEDDAVTLKLKVMPADPVDAGAIIDLLVARGRVRRAVTPQGKHVLVIPGILEHQKIDKRAVGRFGHPDDLIYADSAATDSNDPRTVPTNPHQSPPPPTTSAPGREGSGKEGIRAAGEVGGDEAGGVAAANGSSATPTARGKSPPPSGLFDAEFAAWWVEYPRKIAKEAALEKYRKARKLVDAHALMDGLKASKRRWEAEDRPVDKVPHAATWLHQQRWTDEDSPEMLKLSDTGRPRG